MVYKRIRIRKLPYPFVDRNMFGILLLVLGLIKIGSPCEDVDPPAECLPAAANGDCYWVSNMNCRCSKTCQSMDTCPTHPVPGDTDCMCRTYASFCPGLESTCPATCNYRASVVCDAPESILHAVPSSTENKYMDRITYSCETGYKDDGSGYTGLRLCSENGTWFMHPTNSTPPTCIIISCGESPEVVNTSESQETGVYGDNVTYTCNSGFFDAAANSGYYYCNVTNTTGNWVQVGILPDCQLVTCGAPDSVLNAEPNQTTGVYGDVIGYSCDVGYELYSGNLGQHLCNSTGQWEPDPMLGELPVCRPKCGLPPTVLHATPSAVSGFDGDIIHYLCDAGFRRVSGDIGQLYCNESMAWDPVSNYADPPVCQEISCGAPPLQQNASTNQTSGQFGDVIVYICNTGYVQVGGESGQKVCNESGFWTENALEEVMPDCQLITCGVPPDVSNASASQNSGLYDDVLHYLCDVGYVQTDGGIGQMSCDTSGSWLADALYGNTPLCKQRYCGMPPVVPDASPSQMSGYYGDVIAYSCHDGYIQTAGDIGQMLCNQSGMWSPDPVKGDTPVCTVVTCLVPPTVTHASPSVNVGVYGDFVYYLCDVGYRMESGNIGQMKCSNSGTWKASPLYGEPPLCTGVSCGASPVVPNASVNQTSGTFGDVIAYECDFGYDDFTSNVGLMICNSSAVWDPDASLGTPPSCQVITTTTITTSSTTAETTTVTENSTIDTTTEPPVTTTSLTNVTLEENKTKVIVSTESPVKNIPIYKKYTPPVHESEGGKVIGGVAIIILVVFGLSIVIIDLMNIKQHMQLMYDNIHGAKPTIKETFGRKESYHVSKDPESQKSQYNMDLENKPVNNIKNSDPEAAQHGNGNIGNNDQVSLNTDERPRFGSVGSVIPRRQMEAMRPRLGSAGARVGPVGNYSAIKDNLLTQNRLKNLKTFES